MKNEKPLEGIPRNVEITLALAGLIVLLPVLALVAVLVKLTSPGPILFRQRRVGFGGAQFTLIKFRTMKTKRFGLLVTAETDDRITSLGKKLRKTKIDELPELWNILRGDMSFVGPRPEVPALVNLRNPLWREVLRARPGITDPVTLKLRNEESLLARVADKEAYYLDTLQPYKIRGYAKFLRKKSWQSDVKIICRTLKAVALPQTAPPPSSEEIAWSFAE